ncbi:MAG: hypothetical protein HYT22_02110 [Candidatus Niyogibacteria bacterium]|nr:hypothetical protein [Candidatus Niyogibacteria bacterium]
MKRSVKKRCVHCGFPVSGGGDRHAKNACPPSKNIAHTQRQRRLRRNAKRHALALEKRGAPVVGTGRPKGGQKA